MQENDAVIRFLDLLQRIEAESGRRARDDLVSAIERGHEIDTRFAIGRLDSHLQTAWTDLSLDASNLAGCCLECEVRVRCARIAAFDRGRSEVEERIATDDALMWQAIEDMPAHSDRYLEVLQTLWDRFVAEHVPAPGVGHSSLSLDRVDFVDDEPMWWFPGLALLAAQMDPDGSSRELLDALARARPWLGYAVVEELTDDNVGLTLSPWPIVETDGALLFPEARDPLRLEFGRAELQALVDAERGRWAEAGLLNDRAGARSAALQTRALSYGDVFAVSGSQDAPGAAVFASGFVEHWSSEGELEHDPWYLHGIDEIGLPIVDVSWDARELAKLAHFASAGVVDRAQRTDELGVPEIGSAHALLGLERNVDGRDIPLDDVIAAIEGDERGST